MREKWQKQMPLMPQITDHIQCKELEVISSIIDTNSTICELVLQDLNKGKLVAYRQGANGMSADQVLRCAIVKNLFGFTYKELAFHIVDSQSLSWFCRIGIADKGFKKSALNKNIKAICASTWKRINTELLDHAKQHKIEKGRKVRIDCTCVETNVHYPTDATLLWDAVRVLTRLIERCRQIGIKVAGFHNHSRVAKRRMLAVLNATNLAEVLTGKAVFTQDGVYNDRHKGKTEQIDNKEFDYVQKMLNHIVVPLRTPVAETNQKNTINVDGYYGGQAESVVKAIIDGGGPHQINDDVTITLVDNIKVSHQLNRPDVDHPLKTLEKLIKDYSGLSNAKENDKFVVRGKVVDKEILVGLNQAIGTDDIHPISNPDIGILELYEADDWDGDQLSNYVEVENGIDPINANNNYYPLFDSNSSTPDIPVNITSPNLGYPRGTHGDGAYNNGRLENGLRLPNDGLGFYHQFGTDAINSDNWALPDTIRRVEKVAKEWAARHPDLAPLMKNVFTSNTGNENLDVNNDDNEGGIDIPLESNLTEVRVGFTDFCLEDGGRMCWQATSGQKCHSTHQSGVDLDIRYVRNDNTEGGVNVSDSNFDKGLSQELVELFVASGGAFKIFVDEDLELDETSIIRHLSGHTDHFHVSFRNPNPPHGTIEFSNTTLEEEPNTGVWSTTITTSQVKDKYGLPLFEDFTVVVTTTEGTIYYEGNYIENSRQRRALPLNNEGRVSFELKRSVSGSATVRVETPDAWGEGKAEGEITIAFP